MGRPRVLSGKDVCRILAEQGFGEVRRRGSHIVIHRRTADGTTTVPVSLTMPFAKPKVLQAGSQRDRHRDRGVLAGLSCAEAVSRSAV